MCASCEYSSPVWRSLFKEPQAVNNAIKLTSPETIESLRCSFAADSMYRCVALLIFEICLKARTRQSIRGIEAEPKTDVTAKWPCKVIRCHLFRCHWKATNRLYITVKKIVALYVKVRRQDIVSKRSENRHFNDPALIWRPLLQRTRANISA